MTKDLEERRPTKNQNVRLSRRLLAASTDLLDCSERRLAKSQRAVEASLSLVPRQPASEP
jgi:hypothetical protein